MRYMDVANRLVASLALPINTKTTFDAVSVAVCCTESISTSTLPVPSAVFLLTRNVGAAIGDILAWDCPFALLVG